MINTTIATKPMNSRRHNSQRRIELRCKRGSHRQNGSFYITERCTVRRERRSGRAVASELNGLLTAVSLSTQRTANAYPAFPWYKLSFRDSTTSQSQRLQNLNAPTWHVTISGELHKKTSKSISTAQIISVSWASHFHQLSRPQVGDPFSLRRGCIRAEKQS